jgi:hypothetical protein
MQKVGSQARRIALPNGGVNVAHKTANYLIASFHLSRTATLFG